MLVGGWVKACVPKEKGECYWQTCGVLDEVFGPAAWDRGRGECWDGYGLTLQGSWGRWSWANYFGKSFHLEGKRGTLSGRLQHPRAVIKTWYDPHLTGQNLVLGGGLRWGNEGTDYGWGSRGDSHQKTRSDSETRSCDLYAREERAA